MRSTTSNRPALMRSRVASYSARQRVAGDHGPRQQLGVSEGVGDAVGADRILEAAGVADQCPAGTVRAAHEAGVSLELRVPAG